MRHITQKQVILNRSIFNVSSGNNNEMRAIQRQRYGDQRSGVQVGVLHFLGFLGFLGKCPVPFFSISIFDFNADISLN